MILIIIHIMFKYEQLRTLTVVNFNTILSRDSADSPR